MDESNLSLHNGHPFEMTHKLPNKKKKEHIREAVAFLPANQLLKPTNFSNKRAHTLDFEISEKDAQAD